MLNLINCIDSGIKTFTENYLKEHPVSETCWKAYQTYLDSCQYFTDYRYQMTPDGSGYLEPHTTTICSGTQPSCIVPYMNAWNNELYIVSSKCRDSGMMEFFITSLAVLGVACAAFACIAHNINRNGH